MTKFLANIKLQKSDQKENLTYKNKNNKNIKISDKDN